MGKDDGANNEQIGRRLNIQRGTARTWRERWAAAAPGLQLVEEEGIDDKGLTELIEHVLADEPRRGIVSSIFPRSVGRFLKGSGLEAPSEPLLAER